MKRRLFIYIITAIVFFINNGKLFAEQPAAKDVVPTSIPQRGNGINFIQNKGQIADMNNNLRPDILYVGDGGGMQVYLRKGGISYVLSKTESGIEVEDFGPKALVQIQSVENEASKSQNIQLHRIDMDFVGGNPNTTTLNSDQVEGYLNYYYAHCPNGITGVHAYNKIVYQNVYPNIDFVFYGGKKQGLKYDIIVKPGGDPNNIKLKYSGGYELRIENLSAGKSGGELKIAHSFGEITEHLPKVYQNINGKIIDIKTEYKLSHFGEDGGEAILNFNFGKLNSSFPLVIDPWATYYGGSGSPVENGMDIATDNAGNVVALGYTQSANFPVLAGGFQMSLAGAQNIFVVKFDPAGTRQWATFYGGSNFDYGFAIATDLSDNIFITGETKSSNFPVFGGFQMTKVGAPDAFVVKFNSAGTRQWATYYGGSLARGTGIETDFVGNVFITGYTSTNLPVFGGGQMAHAGGGYDAFVVKFNSAGIRQWATYYGGGGWDKAWGITTDIAGNVFIIGETSSLNLPVLLGTQMSYGWGTYDAFVVKFNSAGVRQWATYYGGSGSDQGYGIVTDILGNVVITGTTQSTNFPVLNGFQMAYGGVGIAGADAFVVKFDPTGIRQWATYYGGTDLDWGLGLVVDGKNNIYLRMEGEDLTAAPSLVADACSWQPVYNGGANTPLFGFYTEDQLIVKFSPTGQKLCATYMGGTGEDDNENGGGIAIYGNALYITGVTNGGYPVTSGAFQTNFGGGNDAFVASVCTNICEAKVLGLNYTASTTSPCPNIPITFTPTINNSCDTTGYRFKWTFTGGNPATSDAINPTVTYATAGNHDVKLVLTTVCKIDSVTKPSYIIITPCGFNAYAGNGTICSGNCATISAAGNSGTPPYTYSWSNGATDQSVFVCPTVTTSYTVIVTDDASNTATAVSVVNVPSTLTVTPSITNISCNGFNNGSAVLSATGGTAPYNYQWSIGSSQLAVDQLAAGNYSVTITDALGCGTYTVISITEPVALTITTSTTTANCNQNSGTAAVFPSGGTAPYFYLWSNNSTNQQISNLVSATYSVTVTDNNGCSQSQNILIGNFPGVTAQPIIISPISCNPANAGGTGSGNNGIATATATGGAPPYSYQWNNNSTSRQISNLFSGTYTVIITDMNGCYSIASANITEPAPLTPGIASLSTISCYGDSTGALSANPSGGTAPYSYLWNTGSTQSTVGNLQSNTYTITITDSNNCSFIDTLTITQPAQLSYTITTADASCNNNNGTATLHLTGGTPGYSYFWQNGFNDSTIIGLSPGTYSVVGYDNNNCSIAANATINNPGGLTATIASLNNVSCYVVNDGSATVSASGGVQPYTYNWSVGSSQPAVNNLSAGTYTITVTDANACSQSLEVTITQPSVPIADAGIDKTICTGEAVTLNASGGIAYQWNTGETTAVVGLQPLATDTYTVIVSNGNCSASDTVRITVMPNATAYAGNDTTIQSGQTAILKGTGVGTYLWSTGETTSTINPHPTSTTSYIFIVRASNGCLATDTVTVFVNSECDEEAELFVPNVFSPNGDRENDVLQLQYIGTHANIYFAIYNRWGEKVFSAEGGPASGWETLAWDGKYKEQSFTSGVFTWILKISCTDEGNEITKKGTVTLLR